MLAATILLLEVVLQVLSFGRHHLYGKERDQETTDPEPNAPLMVCAGDSYTYGMGASDGEHSYPGQLERLLPEATGQSWQVQTAAFPGLDSSEALQRLEDRMAVQPPRIALFLAGINDYHKRPAVLEATSLSAPDEVASTPGFRWQWRTLKLLGIARQGTRLVEAPPEEEAPSEPATASTEQQPQTDESTLPATFAALPPDQQVRQAWVWFWTSKLDLAEQAFEVLEKSHPWEVRAGRIALAGERGQREQHDQWLDELWADLEAGAGTTLTGPDAGSVLMVFRRIADERRATVLADDFVQRFPENAQVFYEAAIVYLFSRRLEDAKSASNQCIRLEPGIGGDPYKWTIRARIFGGLEDPPETAAAIISTYLSGRNEATLRELLLDHADLIQLPVWEEATRALVDSEDETARETREVLQRVFAEVTAPPQEEQAIAAVPDADSPEAAILEVLGAHFALFVDRVREVGGTPVLVSYPVHKPDIQRVMKQVADSKGALFIDATIAIDKAMAEGVEWSDLFIGDGHCNDRGYEIMARQILADLQTGGLLTPPGSE